MLYATQDRRTNNKIVGHDGCGTQEGLWGSDRTARAARSRGSATGKRALAIFSLVSWYLCGADKSNIVYGEYALEPNRLRAWGEWVKE